MLVPRRNRLPFQYWMAEMPTRYSASGDTVTGGLAGEDAVTVKGAAAWAVAVVAATPTLTAWVPMVNPDGMLNVAVRIPVAALTWPVVSTGIESTVASGEPPGNPEPNTVTAVPGGPLVGYGMLANRYDEAHGWYSGDVGCSWMSYLAVSAKLLTIPSRAVSERWVPDPPMAEAKPPRIPTALIPMMVTATRISISVSPASDRTLCLEPRKARRRIMTRPSVDEGREPPSQ